MKQTAIEWFTNQLEKHYVFQDIKNTTAFLHAKEMEKKQMGYTKEDVLKAGEMGEINHHDTKHIVSYLDEAKQYNETFNIIEK
jgi:hypothetical protein